MHGHGNNFCLENMGLFQNFVGGNMCNLVDDESVACSELLFNIKFLTTIC